MCESDRVGLCENCSAVKNVVDDLRLKVDAKERAYDDLFKIYQQSFNAIRNFVWIFGVMITMLSGFSIFQYIFNNDFAASEMERIDKSISSKISRVEKEYSILPYRARISAGKRKLMSKDEQEKNSAVWTDLLGSLNDARSSYELAEVAAYYKDILKPLRDEVVSNKPPRSAVEILWIFKNLLESRDKQIADYVKYIAFPTASGLDEVKKNILKEMDGWGLSSDDLKEKQGHLDNVIRDINSLLDV